MPTYTYTTIDDPAANSGVGTVATGINNAGQIVGYYVNASGVYQGFLYSGGTYTALSDPLGANGTYALGINDSGQIVGYYFDSNHIEHGFLYSGGTYTTIDDPPATNRTFAVGINASGQIVGVIPTAPATTASCTAAALTPRSTIPMPTAAPVHMASTPRDRSSGIIIRSSASAPATTSLASSTAAALTPALRDPRTASTTWGTSSDTGWSGIPPRPRAISRAAGPPPASPILLPPTAPLHSASTTRARLSDNT